MALLEATDLRISYGQIEAVKGISFALDEGQMVTLIGANGAGKSTTLRALSGEVRPAGGTIRFAGETLIGLPPHLIARKGIIQCPEGRRVFGGLTVQENLDLGAYGRGTEKDSAATLEHIFDLFPRLRERRNQLAGTLSG